MEECLTHLVHTVGENFWLCKGGWCGHNLRIVTDELCQEGMKTLPQNLNSLTEVPAVLFTWHLPANRSLALAIKCFILVNVCLFTLRIACFKKCIQRNFQQNIVSFQPCKILEIDYYKVIGFMKSKQNWLSYTTDHTVQRYQQTQKFNSFGITVR